MRGGVPNIPSGRDIANEATQSEIPQDFIGADERREGACRYWLCVSESRPLVRSSEAKRPPLALSSS